MARSYTMHFQLPLLQRGYTTRPYLAIPKLLSTTTVHCTVEFTLIISAL